MKNIFLYTTILLLANCGKSNSPQPGSDPNTPKLVWRKTLNTVLSPTIQPFLVGDKVIYSKLNGDAEPLVALDKNTGEKLWEWSDFSGVTKRVYSELYTFNNTLSGTSGTKIYGIDLADGTTKWINNSPETGSSSLGGIGNHIFHLQEAKIDNKPNTYLKDIDINSGSEKTLWQTITNDDFKPTGYSKPVYHIDSKGDTLLYFMLYGYTFLPKDSSKWQTVCYNLTQKQQVYQTVFYNGIYRGGSTGASVISNGKIYVTMGSYVMCLNQADGKFLWETQRQENNSVGYLTVEDNKIFVCNDYKGISCFDANTGSLIWRDLENSSLASKIVYLNGVIYFTTFGDGFLHAFEANTGKRLLKYDLSPNEGFQYVITLDKEKKRLYLATSKDAICLETIR